MSTEQASKRASKRIVYFDLLTIFAAFAVVVLHCNTMVHAFSDTRSWQVSLVVEVLFYWAVPVFFMLTGANNMTYRTRHTTKNFLIRRMKRLVVPFLVWSLVFYVLRQGIETGGGLSSLSLCGFYNGVMTNSIEGIFWFFPAIIAITLAMPVLSLLTEHRRVLWYLVIVAFVLQFTIPPLAKLADVAWDGAYSLPVASGYVLYVVLGYLLSTQDVPRRARVAVYVAAVACFVVRYAYTLIASQAIGEVDRLLFDYCTFAAAFPAMAVFLFFKQVFGSRSFSPRVANCARTIAGCGFGVYLIHKLFLDDIAFRMLGVPVDSLMLRFAGPFIIFAACVVIVYVMKKVPGLRAIVP